MIFELTITWFASTMPISTVSLVRSVEKKKYPVGDQQQKKEEDEEFVWFHLRFP